MALLYIWKVALCALPAVPEQEDVKLVTLLAENAPALAKAWWYRYQDYIPTWVRQGIFHDRAVHIVMLADPSLTCAALPPITGLWRLDLSEPSPLMETMQNM